MKKKIEVYVEGCDDCKRDDIELATCQICGTTLCTFCSGERASKHKLSVLNKYQAHDFYRVFFIDEIIDDYEDKVHLCLDCMMNPSNKGGVFFRLLEKHEDVTAEFEEARKNLLGRRHIVMEKIRKKIIEMEVAAGKTEKYWHVPDSEFCGMIKGERIREK